MYWRIQFGYLAAFRVRDAAWLRLICRVTHVQRQRYDKANCRSVATHHSRASMLQQAASLQSDIEAVFNHVSLSNRNLPFSQIRWFGGWVHLNLAVFLSCSRLSNKIQLFCRPLAFNFLNKWGQARVRSVILTNSFHRGHNFLCNPISVTQLCQRRRPHLIVDVQIDYN